MKKFISGVVLAVLSLGSQVTMAASIGGFTFDDNAYVDVLLGSFGVFSTSGGSLADVLTDPDAGTFAFSHTEGAYVNLGFADNLLINGAGADLVLFELGLPDSVELSLSFGGTTITYTSSSTGESVGGRSLNAVAIDLDDFSVASGATFSEFFVGVDILTNVTRPSLSLAAALNSTAVPVPAAVWLFGSGLLGLVGMARRKKVA